MLRCAQPDIAGSGELLAGRSIQNPNGMEIAAVFDAKAQARFWSKVNRSGGLDACWLWLGALSKQGYGSFGAMGLAFPAHRASLMIAKGAIGSGLLVDHMCRNRACVNPRHLRAVTPQINSIENNTGPTAENAAKTACDRGHVFTAETMRYYKGWRICRLCHVIRANASHKKMRAQRRRLAAGTSQEVGRG